MQLHSHLKGNLKIKKFAEQEVVLSEEFTVKKYKECWSKVYTRNRNLHF